MEFILPQRGNRFAKYRRECCGVAFDGRNFLIMLASADMAAMGWKAGDKVALGYDPDRGAWGMQKHANGYTLNKQRTEASSPRVVFSANSARLLGVPTPPKSPTADAVTLSRDNGVLVIANPFAPQKPASFVGRAYNAALAV